jgi:peptidoglycan/xylan/chitin deacetylase (PgdA/CDA1 family)
MSHAIFYRVDTRKREVAITFDDGPSPPYTTQILGMLHAAGAHATFFLVGRRALENPDLVRAITAGGNEIGNHTWSHLHLPALLDLQQNDQITRGADALARLGIHPTLFRPPYGLISALGVADVSRIGERTVLWSQALDHAFRVWGDRAAAEMLRRIHPGDIILCHDARPKQLGELRKLLDGLRAKGYGIVTVTELALGTP